MGTVTKNPMDEWHLGETVKVVQCESKHHDHGKSCVCYLIGKHVTIESKVPSNGFVGTATFKLKDLDKTVRLSELGFPNVQS